MAIYFHSLVKILLSNANMHHFWQVEICCNSLDPYFRVSLVLSDQFNWFCDRNLKVYAQMVYLSWCSLYLLLIIQNFDFRELQSLLQSQYHRQALLREKIPSILVRITRTFTNKVFFSLPISWRSNCTFFIYLQYSHIIELLRQLSIGLLMKKKNVTTYIHN